MMDSDTDQKSGFLKTRDAKEGETVKLVDRDGLGGVSDRSSQGRKLERKPLSRHVCWSWPGQLEEISPSQIPGLDCDTCMRRVINNPA